jgi:hypothetical protein
MRCPRLVLGILLACLGGAAAAEDRHVGPGHTYSTIQAAVAAATAGDSVVVHAGTYRETVVVGSDGIVLTAAADGLGGYEPVTITTADRVSGWTPAGIAGRPAIHVATVASARGLGNGMLLADGVLQVPARWPNVTPRQLIGLRNAWKAEAVAGSSTISGGVVTTPSTTDGWYEVAGLPQVDWTGARISYLPGAMWFFHSAPATVDTATGRISFSGTFDTAHTFCQAGNFLYLWGVLSALDAEHEWFHDAAAGRLYYWAPGGVDPDSFDVGFRMREHTIDLSGRSGVTLRGIHLEGGPWRTSTTTNSCTFLDLTVRCINHREDAATNPSSAIGAEEALSLNGNDNLVADCDIGVAGRSALNISGRRNTVRNNLIHHVGYLGPGSATEHQYGINGRQGNNGGADRNLLTGNTIHSGGYILVNAPSAMDVLYNEVFRSHLQGADVGAISAWGTNGRDSVIAWNLVHDNDGLNDDSRRWYGGNAIYLDNGTSDYLIHHNVTWNSSRHGIMVMPHLKAGVPNQQATTSDRRVVANTVHGSIGSADETLAGTAFHSNLSATIAIGSGVTALGNAAYGNDDPRWLDAARRDYHLRDSSLAIDAGTPVAGVNASYTGTAPDAGAFEGRTGTRVAGATITTRHLTALSVSVTSDAAGVLSAAIGGLPEGRKLPEGFRLRIGTQVVDGFISRIDPDTLATTAWRDAIPAVPGRSGVQDLATSIDGGTTWSAAGSADVSGLTISGVTQAGTMLTVLGRHFAASAAVVHRRSLTIANSSGSICYNHPVLLTIDSAAMIAAGELDPALANLRFADADDDIPFWIERGIGTAQTRIWVNVPRLATSTVVTMSYGPARGLAQASDGAATFSWYDDFSDGVFPTGAGKPWYVRDATLTTVQEAGGRLTIATSGMAAGNPYTMQGIATNGVYFPGWPNGSGYAIESRVWFTLEGAAAKAMFGGHDGTLALFGMDGTPDIGYSSASTVIVAADASTLSGSFADRVIGIASLPEAGAGLTTQRWLEDSLPRAMRSGIASSERGYFMAATGVVADGFTMQLDDLRIRRYVFPEPTPSLADAVTTSGGGMQVLVNNVACSGVVRDSDSQLRAVLPAGTVAPFTVRVVDPQGREATWSGLPASGGGSSSAPSGGGGGGCGAGAVGLALLLLGAAWRNPAATCRNLPADAAAPWHSFNICASSPSPCSPAAASTPPTNCGSTTSTLPRPSPPCRPSRSRPAS